jgi:hypothetical protein
LIVKDAGFLFVDLEQRFQTLAQLQIIPARPGQESVALDPSQLKGSVEEGFQALVRLIHAFGYNPSTT